MNTELQDYDSGLPGENSYLTSPSKQSRLLLSGMSVEALVARQDTYSQQFVEQVRPISYIQRITPQEFEARFGYPPAIPLASKLHADYVEQRNREIAEGTYSPGELLPVKLNQPFLRQVFISLGRTDIQHEEKNAHGQVTKAGTEIDWYNPTHSFWDKGDKIMAVRFEPRDSERSSELSFVGFMKENPETGEYEFDATRPILDMAQDPSITFDNENNIILGVVQVYPDETGRITRYDTVQYFGPNVSELKYLQTLPGKDNRLIFLENGDILALYRPQGEIGKRGKIASRKHRTLEKYVNDLMLRPLTKKDLLVTNFQDTNHWGGPNVPFAREKDIVEIYGHSATEDEKGNLHYDVLWMAVDPETGQILYQEDENGNLIPLAKVVATQSDVEHLSEYIPTKKEKTRDVVFTGGAEEISHDEVLLILGSRDARIIRKRIKNPMRNIDRSKLWLVAA